MCRTSPQYLTVCHCVQPKPSPQYLTVSHCVQDKPPGTLVIKLMANDSDTGRNGLVEYTLVQRQDPKNLQTFHLNSSTGELTTRVQLDREAYSEYQVSWQCIILLFEVTWFSCLRVCPTRWRTEDVEMEVFSLCFCHPFFSLLLSPPLSLSLSFSPRSPLSFSPSIPVSFSPLSLSLFLPSLPLSPLYRPDSVLGCLSPFIVIHKVGPGLFTPFDKLQLLQQEQSVDG